MNKNDNTLLNRYIDNDLSEEEKRLFEKRLETDKELKIAIEDIIKLRKKLGELKQLKENEFLTTKISDNLYNKKENQLMKKLIPVIGVIVLTVSLALFYKFNLQNINKFFSRQQASLAAYYTENVKPLFVKTEINNDDVFSFAFNHIIPLDKEKNQYIKIGYDKDGKDYFEIKENPQKENMLTKEKFYSSFNFGDKQIAEMENILDKYKTNIEKQVVLSEKNAIGLSGNLWYLNKLIAAELLDYAQRTTESALNTTTPAKYSFVNSPEYTELTKKLKSPEKSKFVFLTPDTLFSSFIDIDYDVFKADTGKAKKKRIVIQIDTTAPVFRKNDRHKNQMRIFYDDKTARIEIPDIPEIKIPNVDSILKEVEKKQHKFRKHFRIEIPEIPGLPEGLHLKIDSLKNLDIRLQGMNIDSIVKSSVSILDSLKIFGKNFSFKLDSSKGGELKFKFDKEFDEQKFKEEMKKFKEEMKKFKDELKKKLKKQENNIEITE